MVLLAYCPGNIFINLILPGNIMGTQLALVFDAQMWLILLSNPVHFIVGLGLHNRLGSV